jgi:serine/threonine protein kinase
VDDLALERWYSARVGRARRPGGAPVVVKVGPSRPALRREARLLARVHHPGIVRVLGLVKGDAVLVREHLPGGRPTDLGPVRDAVDALHRAGIVHGALTEDHLVARDDGTPALVGFGVARRTTDPAARAADLDALDRLLQFWRQPTVDFAGPLSPKITGRGGAGPPRSRGGPPAGRRRP